MPAMFSTNVARHVLEPSRDKKHLKKKKLPSGYRKHSDVEVFKKSSTTLMVKRNLYQVK